MPKGIPVSADHVEGLEHLRVDPDQGGRRAVGLNDLQFLQEGGRRVQLRMRGPQLRVMRAQPGLQLLPPADEPACYATQNILSPCSATLLLEGWCSETCTVRMEQEKLPAGCFYSPKVASGNEIMVEQI